ncbi:hypothetical protein ACFQ44_06185 [Levilactobacillus lanxiensis]|uniref:Uncharacterized protein n=1 Tax=Levilactobacillus lanxiensis TaxID=2799568 RepID=A0ABW4D545_9LACO|nr:hypothetical protein [Levilactobacillus lanxiensis]
MKLHKLFAVTLAAVSLFGGTLATSTPAMAKTKKFIYYNADDPVHKQYQSMNKYTLNKTFGVKYSSKIRLKHLYVFHVSPIHSRYQSWVKLTGTMYDNGTSDLALGLLDHEGIYWQVDNSAASLVSATGAKFTYRDSVSLDANVSTNSHSHQNFVLLFHSKDKTGKLGETQLKINTNYDFFADTPAQTTKTLNLNLK